MKRRAPVAACFFAFSLLLCAQPASAQQPKVEIGASLANLSVVFGGGDGTGVLIGIPSATFSIFSPAVYASFRAGPRVAVEAQVGLVFSPVAAIPAIC